MKKFVTALSLLYFVVLMAPVCGAATVYDANPTELNSAQDLTLGGSFLGQMSPSPVTAGVSLNIDALTNSRDPFYLLNNGDGRASLRR